MKLTQIIKKVEEAIKSGRYHEDTHLAGIAASNESLNDLVSDQSDLAEFKSAITSDIELSTEDDTQIRENAATAAAAVAFDPGAIKYTGVPGKITFNPADEMQNSDVELSTESFSGSDPKELASISFGFNYGVSKQDAFAEAFFNTVLKPIWTQGVSITIEVDYLQNDFVRDGKGGKNTLIPIIATYNDAKGPLSNNSTALTPVSDVDAANDKYFVKALEKTVVAEGTDELIKTSPLKVGAIVPVLQLSQSEADLKKGVMDRTDTISPDLTLTDVIFKKGDDYITIGLDIYRGSNFSYAPQGDDNGDVVLNLKSKEFTIRLDTLTDSAGNVIDDTNAGYKSVFRVDINGSGNLVDGDVSVFVNSFDLIDVLTADGLSIDPESSEYQDIATKAEALLPVNAVGYNLQAYLVNDNKRRLGREITRRPKTQNYAVRPSAPFTVRMPVKGMDARGAGDGALIPSLVKDVNKQTSMNAVLALTRYVDALRSATAAGVDLSLSPVNGVARHVLKPYFVSRNLNLMSAVDSQTSAGRVADITAALVEQISIEANTMLVDSRYADAVEFIKDTIDVVVGTDLTIGRYLPSTFKISDNVVVKVVTTRNTAMKGRLIIAFGNHGSDRNEEVDPFVFGNHIYVPTLVADTSDNKVREYHVSPIQTHICHMPVIAEIIVTGVSEVARKVAQWTDTRAR